MLIIVPHLITECSAKSGGGAAVVEHHNSPYWEQPFSQPYFDNTTKRETTTTVGQSAYLHCRVRNLGDRAVSFSSSFYGFFLSVHENAAALIKCQTSSGTNYLHESVITPGWGGQELRPECVPNKVWIKQHCTRESVIAEVHVTI